MDSEGLLIVKSVFRKHSLLPMRALFSVALCAAALALFAPAARAETFFTLRELLTSHFHDSTAVGYERVHADGSLQRQLERVGGNVRGDYVVYVARSGDSVDGYALMDQERGQHEMIDLATFFDATGHVTDVQVVAYREAYGDGIRSSRFRRQFVGRDAHSGFAPGRDIDSVSGATLSSAAMARAVARATLVVQVVQHRGAVAHR